MQDTQPLVSVITVCYNHSRFVVECLESIRQQTYQDVQLIIIDDCSKDNSVALIRDWIKTHKVKCVFIAHTKNKGLCKTLNEALNYADGKYISMIATDDVWMLDKIENQVEQMEKLPEDVGVLYSDALQIDEEGTEFPNRFLESHLNICDTPGGNISEILACGNFIPAMTTLIRKACYDTVGKYDEALCYEDWDMWLRISYHYKFAFSSLIAAKYRIVSTSATRTVLKKNNMDYHVSNFIIFSKMVDKFSNNDILTREIKDTLLEIAKILYQNMDDRRNKCLWRTLQHDPRLLTLGMLSFSACRIRYAQFQKFESWFGRYRQKIARTMK